MSRKSKFVKPYRSRRGDYVAVINGQPVHRPLTFEGWQELDRMVREAKAKERREIKSDA